MPDINSFTPKKIALTAASVIGGIVGIIVISNTTHTVQSGEVGLKIFNGRVEQQTLQPGLHFTVPLVETITTVSTQPQTNTSDEAASTHDMQNVDTDVSITYHVNNEDAVYFYTNFRSFLQLNTRILAPIVSNDLKAIISHYNAEELISQRDKVDSEVKALIKTSLLPYRISIESINIANFHFSANYADAIENKQVAEQHAQQATYDLAKEKIDAQKRVVNAKADADAAIEAATGQSKSVEIEAEGKGRAIEIIAEEQAKANAKINASLTPEILRQNVINRWNGELPNYMAGGNGGELPMIGRISDMQYRGDKPKYIMNK